MLDPEIQKGPSHLKKLEFGIDKFESGFIFLNCFLKKGFGLFIF